MSASFPATVDRSDWEQQGWDQDGRSWQPATTAGRTAGRRSTALRRVRTLTALADATGAAIACCLVAAAAPWLGATDTGTSRERFALVSGLLIVTLLATRAAHRGTRQRIAPRLADELGSVLAWLGFSGLALLALRAVAPFSTWLPPPEVALVLGTAALAVPASRVVTMRVASRNLQFATRVAVVGAGELSGELVARLSRSRLVNVLGVVDDVPNAGDSATLDSAPRSGLLGRLEDLPALCETERVDRVVVAFAGRHPARLTEILEELPASVEIDVVARYYELAGWESRLSDLTGLSLVNIGRAPGRWSAVAKRVLDVAVASVALAVLSPLMVTVALAVRLSSGGPVLFRQARVGRGRRLFEILKFRTMRPGPAAVGPARPRSPLDNRPDFSRVTPVGRWLRRTGIDELPQLLNILKGEMSLVGPRPFVAEECVGLRGRVERRFDVRPGMTGMWQVCGQHEVTLDELCRLDAQYATSWSLRGDLRILARTPTRLVRGSAEDR